MNVYDVKSVMKGRNNYHCVVCEKEIPKGTPSTVHHLMDDSGEYPTERTHKECSNEYQSGEQCRECGEWTPKGNFIILGPGDKMSRNTFEVVCLECVDDDTLKTHGYQLDEESLKKIKLTPAIVDMIMKHRPDLYEKNKTQYISIRFGI